MDSRTFHLRHAQGRGRRLGIALMKMLKRNLDPKGILNPGKVLETA